MKLLFLGFSIVGFLCTALFYTKGFHFNWQWMWFFLYIVCHFSIWPKLPLLFSSFSKMRAFFSLLLAFFWLCSSHNKALLSLSPLGWWVAFMTFLLFSLSFYCFLYVLEKSQYAQEVPHRGKWRYLFLYSAIPGLIWGVYFLTYAPAKMTYDSFWQWAMAHHIMPYNAWQPVLHTWFIEATTWLSPSPACYTLCQIVLMSVSVGYAIFYLQESGLSFKWALLMDLFYAVNPINGFYSVTMWKDILFASFILLLTVLLTKVYRSKGSWLNQTSHKIGLVMVALTTMLLRDNGGAVVLASLVGFIILVKGVRLRLSVLTLFVLILYGVFQGPLMSINHVIKNPLNQALAIPSQQIAYTFKENGRFTPHLKTYYVSILPEKNWVRDYTPTTVNPIKHDPSYHSSVISGDLFKYLKNWTELLVLNPVPFVKAYLNQVSAVWQFQTPKAMKPYFDSGLVLQDYPLGIKLNAPSSVWQSAPSVQIKAAYQHYVSETHRESPTLNVMTYNQYKKIANETVKPLVTRSLLPQLKRTFDALFYSIQGPLKNYLIKGAIPLCLFVMSMMVMVRRLGWHSVGSFLPAGFVLVTILMAMPAPDFRYSFGFIFTIPFLFWVSQLEGKV